MQDLQQLTKALFEKMRKVDELMDDMRNIVADVRDHIEDDVASEDIEAEVARLKELKGEILSLKAKYEDDDELEKAYEELGFTQSVDGFTYKGEGLDILVERYDIANNRWLVFVNDRSPECCNSSLECYEYVKLIIQSQ